MSYVAHQYSRVDFYSSLEVNLSLYYGGVGTDDHISNFFNTFKVTLYSVHLKALWKRTLCYGGGAANVLAPDYPKDKI